jgi:hypothetical protein
LQLHLALFPLAAILCGLSYRIRGGLWGDYIRAHIWKGFHDFAGRGQFAALTAAFAFAAGVTWWQALLAGAGFFAGETVGLFGALAIRNAREIALLSLNGLLSVALPAIGGGLLGLSWWWLAAVGASRGGLYVLARAHTLPWKGFGWGVDFPETGEALFGAAIGVGLLATILA